MTNPTLEQYIEGVDKEFGEKFPSHLSVDGKWKSSPVWDVEETKSFLKSSIQGAWEKRDNEWREGIKECIEDDVGVLHVSLEKIFDLLEQMEGEK